MKMVMEKKIDELNLQLRRCRNERQALKAIANSGCRVSGSGYRLHKMPGRGYMVQK